MHLKIKENKKIIAIVFLFIVIIIGIFFAYQKNYSFSFEEEKTVVLNNNNKSEAPVNNEVKDQNNQQNKNIIDISNSQKETADQNANSNGNKSTDIKSWILSSINITERKIRILKVPDDYKSIQMAIENAKRGDRIEVSEGEYNENLTMKNGVGVIGAGAEKTTINGNNLGNVIAFKDVFDSKTEITGFTIKNSANNLNGIMIEDSSPWIHDNVIANNEYGIYVKGESRPVIQKNVINFANRGIQLYNFEFQKEIKKTEEVSAEKKTIEKTKESKQKEEFIKSKTNPIIIDNLISDNKIGIDIVNSSAGVNHNSISYNNHYKTYLGATFGINVVKSSAEITNNIISDSGICELCVGLMVDKDSKNMMISYNNIWNNKNNYICYGECVFEDNNISEDPLYVDYINGDYSLGQSSVLIGKARDGLDIGVRW